MDTLMGSPTKGSPRAWVCLLQRAVEKTRVDRHHCKTGLLESFTTQPFVSLDGCAALKALFGPWSE